MHGTLTSTVIGTLSDIPSVLDAACGLASCSPRKLWGRGNIKHCLVIGGIFFNQKLIFPLLVALLSLPWLCPIACMINMGRCDFFNCFIFNTSVSQISYASQSSLGANKPTVTFSLSFSLLFSCLSLPKGRGFSK